LISFESSYLILHLSNSPSHLRNFYFLSSFSRNSRNISHIRGLSLKPPLLPHHSSSFIITWGRWSFGWKCYIFHLSLYISKDNLRINISLKNIYFHLCLCLNWFIKCVHLWNPYCIIDVWWNSILIATKYYRSIWTLPIWNLIQGFEKT